MRDKELSALAMVAIRMISVDEQGRVWRHREVVAGSAADCGEMEVEPRRADTGRSKKGGYLRVQLTIDKRRFWVAAHRLVWMVANCRMIPDVMEVNHKDGDKTNNHPSNLELVTRARNTAHYLHKLGGLKLRNHPGAKLSPEQVLEIRDLCDQGSMSKAAIARHFGVTVKTIRNIQSRAKWAELLG